MLDTLRFSANRFVKFGFILLMVAGYAMAANHRPVLSQSRQILVLTTPDWQSVSGTAQRYERRRAGESWRKVGEPIAVVVGKGGMGWGDGVEAVSGHAATDPVKQEGDRRSPAGVFRIGSAFGYPPDKPVAWVMPYIPLTLATECVDDRNSKYYNQIVERTNVTSDWNSSEHMRSAGVYYQWGAIVEQNPENKPGDGSCVFLHVWDGTGGGTSGCTAMAKPELETVLNWLKPGGDPLLIAMPIAEYRRVAKALRLPSQ